MKIFNSNKMQGKVVLEVLVDGRTHAVLKALEDAKMVCELKYKVLDGETVALYLDFKNPIDNELQED